MFFLLFLLFTAQSFDWALSSGFPAPPVPTTNPMSLAKVELGRHLFYDQRLSVNNAQSCASCHRQELAFTDGLAQAKGTTGELHPRSSMSLVNVAYAPALTWANPTLSALEEQALTPMFGTHPVELGLHGREASLLSKLRANSTYQRLFPSAFPGEADPFTIPNLTRALAAFQRTIISTRSPYDRYRYGGDPAAISPAAKRGELLFFSGEKAGCFQCHGGWNFSGPLRHARAPQVQAEFHDTRVAAQPASFRAPTLRNIALTAPYMHNGSLATLSDVIDHYARQSPNPARPSILRPFQLTPQEKADLIAFLNTLTDHELLRDPRWSNPWK